MNKFVDLHNTQLIPCYRNILQKKYLPALGITTDFLHADFSYFFKVYVKAFSITMQL